jgi:hypothetical protein
MVSNAATAFRMVPTISQRSTLVKESEVLAFDLDPSELERQFEVGSPASENKAG